MSSKSKTRKKANAPKWTPEQEALLRKARHEGCLLFHDDLHALGLCANAIGKTNGRGNRNLYNDFCAPLVVYGTNLAPKYYGWNAPEAESEIAQRDQRGDIEWDTIAGVARFTPQGKEKVEAFKKKHKQAGKGSIGIYVVSLKEEVDASATGHARPIAPRISQEILTRCCAHCWTRHEIVTDHKLDWCEPRVLCEESQQMTDFQALCNRCNMLKKGFAGKGGYEAQRQAYTVFPLTKPVTAYTPFDRLREANGHQCYTAFNKCRHESLSHKYIELRRLIQNTDYWSNCEWHSYWHAQLKVAQPFTVESVCALLAHEAIDIPTTRAQWRLRVEQLLETKPTPDAPKVCNELYDFLEHTLDMGRSAVDNDCLARLEDYVRTEDDAQVQQVVHELCVRVEYQAIPPERTENHRDNTSGHNRVETIREALGAIVL